MAADARVPLRGHRTAARGLRIVIRLLARMRGREDSGVTPQTPLMFYFPDGCGLLSNWTLSRAAVRIAATQVRIGATQVRIGATQVRIGGARVRIAAAQVRVGGARVRIGALHLRVTGRITMYEPARLVPPIRHAGALEIASSRTPPAPCFRLLITAWRLSPALGTR